ncbi:MAG: phage repressor protein CI [Plesiomonas shigelloides]
MDTNLDITNELVLNRICDAYGFTQKIQLARHFDISAGALQSRYTRGSTPYDFIVRCHLETNTSIKWLLTGIGEQTPKECQPTSPDELTIKSLILNDAKLLDSADLRVPRRFFTRTPNAIQSVQSGNTIYFLELDAPPSDGTWLVDIDGSKSIRSLAFLPGKKLHVSGGEIHFECGIDEIKLIGRVVGIYSEVN